MRNSAVPVEDSAVVASSMVLTQPEVEGKEDLQQTSSDDNSVSQKLSDGQSTKGTPQGRRRKLDTRAI